MKAASTSLLLFALSLLATVSDAKAPACVNLEQNVDYYGNDIASVVESNYQKCCTWCQIVDGCNVYIWNSYN
ncbi:hypothetical protein SDRG_17309, partial [Saprolegnia diclina VS20]